MSKKMIAFCAGRRGSNVETYVKLALREAETMGLEAELIRLSDCDIRPCRSCNKMMCMVNGPDACIIKDDCQWLFKKYKEADAVIFAAPVYCLSPVGIMTDFRDRILGPRSSEATAQMDGPIPEWMGSKGYDRVGGLISVGGALTRNWTSLGLATLYTLAFPAGIRIVDHLDAYGVADPGEALMSKHYMDRARLLGKNVAYAALHPEKEWTHQFWGETEEAEACPGCHASLLIAHPGKKTVECAICGRTGDITMDEEGMHFNWPEDRFDRLTDLGDINHVREIHMHTREVYEPALASVEQAIKEMKGDNHFIVRPEKKN